MTYSDKVGSLNVSAFYDGWTGRFLADYVYGNPRTEAAIRHAAAHIPRYAKRILDLGCGIGWSTWEIRRTFPRAFVLGVDLNEKAVEIATRLFGDSNAVFRVGDVAHLEELEEAAFDAIVLIDVYEHIPRKCRAEVHAGLRAMLADKGHVILTFPSVAHQNLLRRHAATGLQPIDEDVTFEDMRDLADALGGRIETYSDITIWRANDYVHAAIVLSQNEEPVALAPSPPLKRGSQRVRLRRVSSRLNVRVTCEGLLLPNRGKPVVCVISPNRDAYSETFIRSHIEHLATTVKLLHGGSCPTHREDGKLLMSDRPTARIVRAVWRRLCGQSPESFHTGAVARFLTANAVDVVLAEYGPTGVAMLDACTKAGVSLLVHFHGYDAYHRPTLERYGEGYARLFREAAAIVAVSRDMERVLLSLGAPRDRLFYNPYGVDFSTFSRGEPGAAAPVFVAVGRFVEKKAPHLVVLAFAEVRRACPEARLIMVGDGPLWGATQHLARVLNVADAIEFLGPRSHAEVAAIMRRARAFVQHSVVATDGDAEGTPVAVLEAGATGLPVIATRHGGIPDVVLSGHTGFLVGEGDVGAMAAHMIQLATDPLLADRLGRGARERVCAEFSTHRAMDTLLRILEIAWKHRQG
jgi:glycosyltransferase involved in cell wall biosynthesis/protein-L-isoaspartate O-methyltransferase